MKNFNNEDQLRAYMKKETKNLNFNIKNVYSTYIARLFLEKLAKYNNDQIIVKGSSSELAYLGRIVRTITDIDLASLNGLVDNVEILSNIINDTQDDNFNFKLKENFKKTKTGIYKLSFEAKYNKIVQTLGIDYQENYNRLIEPERRIMSPIFEGDNQFEIYVPSFEEYLAEKLCIILESKKENVLNTRVKDFYDIYQLHGGDYNPEKFTEYFKKMIQLRGKINIEDAKTLNLNYDFVKNHEKLWDKTKRSYDFLDKEIDLAAVVFYTRAVIREQLQKNGILMDDNLKKR